MFVAIAQVGVHCSARRVGELKVLGTLKVFLGCPMDKWFSLVDGDVTHWSSFCLHFAVVFVWILGGSTFLLCDENIRLMKQPYPRKVWSESVDAWRWRKKVSESWIQTILLFGDQVNFHFCEPSYVAFYALMIFFHTFMDQRQNPINEMWRVKDILRRWGNITLQTLNTWFFIA